MSGASIIGLRPMAQRHLRQSFSVIENSLRWRDNGNSYRRVFFMGYDQDVVRALYKRLLDLYPRAFRERFGESMEQTFNDLCKERGRTAQGLIVFVLSTFVETTIGMLKEYLLVISQGDTMRRVLKSLGLSAIISLLLVLPFMILEWTNNRNPHQEFPIALFVFMW